MKTHPIAWILALSALLAGCVADDSQFATPTETYVKVSDTGVGGINGETRYSSSDVRGAMPGFEVEGILTAQETDTERALGVFKDGIQVLQVFNGSGGTVGAVHGVTNHLVGPSGERIGMTFAQAGIDRSDCRVGTALWRGMAICPARNTTNVTLVFAVPEYQGPFDRLPDSGDLRIAELQRIIWRP